MVFTSLRWLGFVAMLSNVDLGIVFAIHVF